MKINNECVVSISYILTNDEGERLDSSGKEPLVYLHGADNIVKGLEQALYGKEAGTSFKAAIEPALGYGEVDTHLIQEVPRGLLAKIENLYVGMALQSESEDGHVQRLVVDAIGDDTVTINANHPLAGTTLHFDVTVENVREATREEIEHGHPH